MAQPATTLDLPELAWLETLLADLEAAREHLTGWSLSLWEGGVRVALQADGQAFSLDLLQRVDGPDWNHTPSFSMFIKQPDGQALTFEAGNVADAFVAALTAADDGTLPLPQGSQIATNEVVDDTPLTLEQVLEWRDAEDVYKQQLHEFSFYALQSLLTDDLYPHVMSLGEPIPEEEIQASWQEVDRLMTAGRAPDKLGLYVHVPYCTVECSFCYCGKTEHFTRSDFDTYVDKLLREMDVYAPMVAGQQLTSLYFGGGTPSLLTPPAMRRLFTQLYDSFDVPEGTQVIFEGNPDSLKPNKVDILADLGRVTRLTIGIQTLDPKVQEYVRRHNKREDVEAAIGAAKAAGIPHVNFDTIAGLPGQTMESWQRDINYLLSLEPDSIHLNGFRPLPRTIFSKGGQAMDPELEKLRDEMLAWGEERLAQQGFSGALGQGPHKTMNAANMQEYNLRTQNSSLLGLGYPSRSHSFGGWYYIRDTQPGFVDSLRQQNAGERAYRGIRADLHEEMCKYVVTNIRAGFVRQEFVDLFGQDPFEALPDGFTALKDLGVVEERGGRVHFLTGRLVDAIIYRMFFYSENMANKARAKWGHKYDKDEDYRRHLEYLVPAED